MQQADVIFNTKIRHRNIWRREVLAIFSSLLSLLAKRETFQRVIP